MLRHRRPRAQRRRRSHPAFRAVLTTMTVLAAVLPGAAARAAAAPAGPQTPEPARQSAKRTEPGAPDRQRVTVAPMQRDVVLPAGWRNSTDFAWTTSGDSTGFHILVADSDTGYTWRTVASLVEPGFDTDRWIGNVCFTGSGRRAVVVYAPRQFTNRESLFQRGGFAALVDVASGGVTKLPVMVSLAYYNPGCGVDETAVLTQSGLSSVGKTRLYVTDAAARKIVRRHELPGQVTSSVPVAGEVVAAGGPGLVRIDTAGRSHDLARTHGVPYRLRPTAGGGVAFMEAHGDTTAVVEEVVGGQVREFARGPLQRTGLAAGIGGRAFLTGSPSSVGALPAAVSRVAVPAAGSEVSSHGLVAVTHRTARNANGLEVSAAVPTVPGRTEPVALRVSVPSTGKAADFDFTPGVNPAKHLTQGSRPNAVTGQAGTPARSAAPSGQPAATASPPPIEGPYGGVTTDPDRTCAVSRNAASTQVYQPSWRQVEWAADLAVQGALTVARPTNWHNSGLPAWTPQGMFPRAGLATGSGDRVPAPILLGVLAQESNLWQASNHALEGEYGNPLVGNFYGRAVTQDNSGGDPWAIDWAEADCGYGVAQITDGMRLADTSRTGNEKVAIAVDYATNIAAGLRILEQKYNQTWTAHIRMNSGNPKWIENWFAALWAYNTGVQPRDAEFGNPTGCTPSPSCTDGDGNWGLGWANNPINPDYPADRHPFLNGYPDHDDSQDDARTPQYWPYPEKVMGWAGFPIVKSDPWTGDYEAGYSQAWWTDKYFRFTVKPPRDLFCRTDVNHCDPERAQPCLLMSLRCWWNGQATYKPSCLGTVPGQTEEMVSCGQESIRFGPGDPDPGDWEKWYKPDCINDSRVSPAYLIDDVPTSVPSLRQTNKLNASCSPKPFTSSGQLSFRFAQDSTGHYRSKIDFHQLGGGFGGHLWFAHTYQAADDDFRVTGVWRLNTSLNSWARVMVYIPDHAAQTQQARYEIDTGDGAFSHYRVINTKSDWVHQAGRWVPLGVFNFNGVPQVSLSNITRDGAGIHDVAWDAIMIQPLPAKPKNFVAVLGDSYTSGEGAVTNLTDGTEYEYQSDSDGKDPANRNTCHRSYLEWAEKGTLKDEIEVPIRSRVETLDRDLDFHTVACSGATTGAVLQTGQFGEVPQIDSGFLDDNTTLVAMTIGGDDARFSKVLIQCVKVIDQDCQNTVLSGDSKVMGEAEVDLILNTVEPAIKHTIEQVHARAPNAKIIVLGYPLLISGTGACVRLGTFDTPIGRITLGISESETVWINDMGDFLADRERIAVEDTRIDENIPVWFGDARPYFAGKGVCGDPEHIHRAVLSYTPGEDPEIEATNPWWRIGVSQQTFHPNPEGTSDYANAFIDALRAHGL